WTSFLLWTSVRVRPCSFSSPLQFFARTLSYSSSDTETYQRAPPPPLFKSGCSVYRRPGVTAVVENSCGSGCTPSRFSGILFNFAFVHEQSSFTVFFGVSQLSFFFRTVLLNLAISINPLGWVRGTSTKAQEYIHLQQVYNF
ncbi:unnamed protein product, partial [Brassica rapa subsp. trilocularis]